jgi:hypothetical protein
MPFSMMRRRLDFDRTDVSEEHVVSIFGVRKIRKREKCLTIDNTLLATHCLYFEGRIINQANS